MTRLVTTRLKMWLVASGLALVALAPTARAQSEASAALSALPMASVAVGASAGASAGAAVSVLPVALSAGSVLVVKTVEASARGTVYLLERASDGARASVEVSTQAAGASLVGVGTVVTVSAIGTGTLISAAGQVLAFIPNELGRALLHNERVTR